MKAKIGTSFGLALIVAIGVFATMLALGMFNPSPAKAADVTSTTITTAVNSPIIPGDTAAYTVTFKNDATLTAGSGQITVRFDSGIGVPSSMEKERITISASGGGTSNPLFDPTITTNENGDKEVVITVTQDLTVFDDASTSDGHIIQFSTLAGITNATFPSTSSAWIQISIDGSTFTAKDYIEVYSYLLLNDTSDARDKALTITGKGFKTGTATIFIDKNNDQLFDTGDTKIGSSDASISGGEFTASFTADTNFSVGNNSINAVDGSGLSANNVSIGARYASQSFELRGKISTDKASSSRGGTVKVSLADYGGGTGSGTVSKITFGGVEADLTGKTLTYTSNSASISVTVPSTTPLGTQRVEVTASNESARNTTMEITGIDMSVSPTTAVANQSVTVSASGFTASGTIANDKLTVGGIVQATLTSGAAETTVTADNSGNMVLTFKIPNSATTRTAGTHVIRITDSGNIIGEVDLTVPARTIVIDPDTSRRASTVSYSGSGYPASKTVTISFLSGSTTTTVDTSTADSSGNISGSFTVPNSAGIPSTNTVTATGTGDSSNDTLKLTSTVTHKVPGASITVTPTSAASGDTITVTGVDFPGFVSLQLLDIGEVSALPTPAPSSDSSGNFTVQALVPALATGSHNLSARVGGSSSGTTATTSFTVVEGTTVAVVTSNDTDVTFADEITADNLVRVWRFSNETQGWSFFDPRPAFSAANTYTTAASGDIVWVNVTEETTFQGATLFPGWNLISLNG